MWTGLVMTPRLILSIIWSIPIWAQTWILTGTVKLNWIPVAFIVFFSVVIQYAGMQKEAKNKTSPLARVEILKTWTERLRPLLFISLLTLIVVGHNSRDPTMMTVLLLMYLLAAAANTALGCTRYNLKRYGLV